MFNGRLRLRARPHGTMAFGTRLNRVITIVSICLPFLSLTIKMSDVLAVHRLWCQELAIDNPNELDVSPSANQQSLGSCERGRRGTT